jgi:hypothetical protein
MSEVNCAKPEREPAVARSLGRLREGLNELEKVFGQLNSRLAGVVRSPDPACAGESDEAAEPVCSLSGELDGCWRQLDARVRFIQELLDRLEV